MRFTGGLPETACGFGSTLRGSEGPRTELRGLLDRLGVTSLLDAPCGDFNWLAQVDLTGIAYVGIDVSLSNLATARRNAPDRDFRHLDILSAELPRCGAILCRDFLQHLPNHLAIAVVDRFRATGAAWLIATSHDAPENSDIDRVGDFRPLNLVAAPIGLDPPLEVIGDGPGRILGAWRL